MKILLDGAAATDGEIVLRLEFGPDDKYAGETFRIEVDMSDLDGVLADYGSDDGVEDPEEVVSILAVVTVVGRT